jgi:hypothetical protein
MRVARLLVLRRLVAAAVLARLVKTERKGHRLIVPLVLVVTV